MIKLIFVVRKKKKKENWNVRNYQYLYTLISGLSTVTYSQSVGIVTTARVVNYCVRELTVFVMCIVKSIAYFKIGMSWNS